MNLVVLSGRIATDLKLVYSGDGVAILNFMVATSHVYFKPGGEKVENTDFHNVVAYAKAAENIAKFLSKGHPITISNGQLKTRKYQHSVHTDVTLYKTEVRINDWEFAIAPPNSDSANHRSTSGSEGKPSQQDPSFDRGIPPSI